MDRSGKRTPLPPPWTTMQCKHACLLLLYPSRTLVSTKLPTLSEIAEPCGAGFAEGGLQRPRSNLNLSSSMSSMLHYSPIVPTPKRISKGRYEQAQTGLCTIASESGARTARTSFFDPATGSENSTSHRRWPPRRGTENLDPQKGSEVEIGKPLCVEFYAVRHL